jgi:hypothetical protein
MAYYKRTSPYYTTEINGKYLDIANFPNLPKEQDDVLYTILPAHHNRPDLLAYDLYGDSNLWWVFAMRNPDIIKDPVFDLIAGARIYIPKQKNLTSILG